MDTKMRKILIFWSWWLVPGLLWPAGCVAPKMEGGSFLVKETQWFKGNTHCHSWKSDGTHPPEMVVQWYKQHGYNFLMLSDHGTVGWDEKWVVPEGRKTGAVQEYEEAFGPEHLQKRTVNDRTLYRLKPLAELQSSFNEPGRFLLLPGAEMGISVSKRSLHLNYLNAREVPPPPTGDNMTKVMQEYSDALRIQQLRYNEPMVVQYNHPNFQWALAAEEMVPLPGTLFFEVYNGHPGVRNYGDSLHCSVERMWDIILTRRLAEWNLPVAYGMASDDAHALGSKEGGSKALPGRGWIMVRASRLAWPSIHEALNRGDFYATTGVVLKDIRFENNRLTIDIKPKAGVSYQTRFIGTMKGYDPSSLSAATQAAVTRIYSDQIGKVLNEQSGTHAVYKLTGNEIYVRAKVISSASHSNPHAAGDVEVAWVQPVCPRR